jgi:hypothetical protein
MQESIQASPSPQKQRLADEPPVLRNRHVKFLDMANLPVTHRQATRSQFELA